MVGRKTWERRACCESGGKGDKEYSCQTRTLMVATIATKRSTVQDFSGGEWVLGYADRVILERVDAKVTHCSKW